MGKTIVIVSTLDTKGAETIYLKEQIEKEGFQTIVIDVGTKGCPTIEADITREEVLAAAGEPGADAVNAGRPALIQAVSDGAGRKVKELYRSGRLDGIVGIGGATGTLLGTGVMKALPFGVPKLMVSSVAAARGLTSRYFGTADIDIMHSVVDFTGLNDLMRSILDRAAGSITGMAGGGRSGAEVLKKKQKGKALVAMTQLNMCEKCASMVRDQLEREGCQVVGFSATGVADKAMEELIEREGMFEAVIDLAPGGVGEEILGGTRAAGPNRLEAAGKMGLPQVIAPCCVNLMTPPKSKYKPDYYNRKRYDLDAHRTFLRVAPDELVTVAGVFAEKLNLARGPVKFLVPLRGWSAIDGASTVLYDPDTDRIFVDELKRRLKSAIEIREIDANLEDPEFARAVVAAFREVMAGAAPAAEPANHNSAG
ncbi:MAG: Tm-1-like ATP-binding domain-containing protein [Bacillota bacterium]